MAKPVLVIGDPAVDLIVHFPQFVNGDRSNVIFPRPDLQCGGTAANTAVSLARLGIPTAFIGTVGDDQYGRFIINDFKKEGIDTTQLFVDAELNTVCVFAFIDEQGERYLWGWPREKQSFREIPQEKVDFAKVRSAAWVHSSGMSLVGESSGRRTVIATLKAAFEAGVPTSLDLNLRINGGYLDPEYREVVLEAIQYCSVVFGSGEEEFAYLHPCERWEDSARSFVTERRSVVARMGAQGSMLMTPTQTWHAAGFPVTVMDTVGAGDVYNGGFIAASLLGKSGPAALAWGNAVAAFKITRSGARSSPTRAEMEAFLREMGWNEPTL